MLPQKAYPQLQYLEIEQVEGGEVAMTMVFQSLDTPYRLWAEEERVQKYNTFFGPGCWAQVVKVSGEDKLVGECRSAASMANCHLPPATCHLPPANCQLPTANQPTNLQNYHPTRPS